MSHLFWASCISGINTRLYPTYIPSVYISSSYPWYYPATAARCICIPVYIYIDIYIERPFFWRSTPLYLTAFVLPAQLYICCIPLAISHRVSHRLENGIYM